MKGTEIGGAFITSSLMSPQTPSGFTMPTLGSQVVVLQDSSAEDIRTTDTFVGYPLCISCLQYYHVFYSELAIAPPAIGLSQSLLNKDHTKEYYLGMPHYGPHNYLLRRHGDVFEKTAHGFYFSRGRSDDTMNLGGIKVDSLFNIYRRTITLRTTG